MTEDVPEIHSPALKAIHAYYRSLATADGLPGRQHIDPAALRTLLPHIVLADVVEDDFRLRLIGTRVVDIWGRDHTGYTFSSFPNTPFVEGLRRSYARARDEKRIIHWMATRPVDSLVFYERLAFPLARDGRTVDMVMGAVDFARNAQGHPVTLQGREGFCR
ncbi:PAS domain-containing protein [Arenibaculum pallidiluteum]|uniref:PAS domain-containing protein n=1 Tax=Arenibaculum pallidiluteum TaxID=2812559 RepID=UPI001A962A7F|nr:PAS domain-containing protein [Arenibaculum pallidiluteum]